MVSKMWERHFQFMHAEQVLAEDAPFLKPPHPFRDFQPPVASGEMREGLSLGYRKNLCLLLRKARV